MEIEDTPLLGSHQIHRVGFGACLTGKGTWGEPRNPAACKAVLRRAVELGANFIDTADAYGPEGSERLIADALHPYPNGLILATKAGFTRPGPGRWKANGRPEHIRRACEGSLRRLRLERLPLYQLHAPDPNVPIGESIGAMADLKREGKVQYIGLSNVEIDELASAMKTTDIASVQNEYNLLERSSDAVLEICEKRRLAFIPYYPLAAGDLARRKAPRLLADIARRHGATPAQVALAWLLSRSPVIIPIPGTMSLAHLEENMAATRVHLQGTEVSALDRLEA